MVFIAELEILRLEPGVTIVGTPDPLVMRTPLLTADVKLSVLLAVPNATPFVVMALLTTDPELKLNTPLAEPSFAPSPPLAVGRALVSTSERIVVSPAEDTVI